MTDIKCGDCIDELRKLEAGSVHCCVTSPPYYGLRDYGHAGQIGLEPTLDAYVRKLVEVFAEVRRILRPDGTLWLNLGDSYASGDRVGHGTRVGDKQQTNRGMNGTADSERPPTPPGCKPKDLLGVPWRVAFALQEDGWYLRSDIVWHKPNPMPESVTDRPTRSHEYVFLLAKQERYYYAADAIAEKGESNGQFKTFSDARGGRAYAMGTTPTGNEVEGGGWTTTGRRNKRTVWTVPSGGGYPGAHFAVMPEALVEPCVLAGCPEGGLCLDPFCGSGTVGVVAYRLGRRFVGIDLNGAYIEMARGRIAAEREKYGLFREQWEGA